MASAAFRLALPVTKTASGLLNPHHDPRGYECSLSRADVGCDWVMAAGGGANSQVLFKEGSGGQNQLMTKGSCTTGGRSSLGKPATLRLEEGLSALSISHH